MVVEAGVRLVSEVDDYLAWGKLFGAPIPATLRAAHRSAAVQRYADQPCSFSRYLRVVVRAITPCCRERFRHDVVGGVRSELT
jgi:hypothetical protein